MLKKDKILAYFKENPATPYRELARQFNTSRSFIKRILKSSETYVDRSPTHSVRRTPVIQRRSSTELYLADLHIPYQSRETLEQILSYADDMQPDILFLGGDIADFYSISNWRHDPQRVSFQHEVEQTRSFLQELRDRFPKADMYYMLGNHEERVDSYLKTKAPEMLNLDSLSIPGLFKLDDFHITYIDTVQYLARYRHPFSIHGLNHIHGHEFHTSWRSVQIAKQIFTRTCAPTIFGHFHKTDEYIRKRYTQDVIGSWSVGCACDLIVEFAPLNDWTHGFAEVYYYGDDDFHVKNRILLNGRIY